MSTLITTDNGQRLTVLYGGRQGPQGNAGPAGPTGPAGASIIPRGTWSPGNTYAAGDAVTADSTVAQGIESMFVQRTGTTTAVSTTPPRDDLSRWMEIGPTDLSNVTGAIWLVTQPLHGFTKIGEPVGYSAGANRWVLANNVAGDTPAVAVVRDILTAGEVILQTTGEIVGLDPSVITPPAAQFTPGILYYAADSYGFLTPVKPSESTAQSVNPMLVATGPTSGVVLQWQAVPNFVGRRPVGYNSFYYTATAGQTVFTGVDLAGNTLAYTPSDQTRVLVNGLDVFAFDGFTATTGTSVTLAVGAALNAKVEIRVLAEPLDIIAPSTALRLDNIAGAFDGVQTTFLLTVDGGTDVELAPAANYLLFLDGIAQEPFADYSISLPGVGTGSEVSFISPPPIGTRFWGIVGVAVGPP